MSSSHRDWRSLSSSLHTHSEFCDGHGRIEEYARAAAQAGLGAFGASGHAPLPFACDYAMPLAVLDTYRAEIARVRDELEGTIPVYAGLELDYLPGLADFYAREFLTRRFDYFVASVHYLGEPGTDPWAYDESEERFVHEITVRHGGDARPAVEDYYRRVQRMVQDVAQWDVPTFVGHLDRIALWNRDDRYFPTDSQWYRQIVDDTLDAIRRAGLAVELNTSGWWKPIGRPNPSAAILERCALLRIPSILSADAHRPEHVARGFDRGFRLLLDVGIREMIVPSNGGWQRVPLATKETSGPLAPRPSPAEESQWNP